MADPLVRVIACSARKAPLRGDFERDDREFRVAWETVSRESAQLPAEEISWSKRMSFRVGKPK